MRRPVRTAPARTLVAAFLCGGMLLSSGCGSGTTPPAGGGSISPSHPYSPATYLPSSAFRPLGSSGCHPVSPAKRSPVGLEVLATAKGGTVWGLLIADLPVPTNRQIKIVWRVSGSSNLRVEGWGPSGLRAQIASLQRHSGSNWRRPGREWGSEFLFQRPGCWDLRATAGKVSGDVWVMVK